jgi:hypothetical protein
MTDATTIDRERLASSVALKLWPNHPWDEAAGWQRDIAYEARDTILADIAAQGFRIEKADD